MLQCPKQKSPALITKTRSETPLREPRLTLFLAVYWFLGAYLAAWFIPYAYQIGFVGVIMGMVLLRWFFAFEDRGQKTPPALGCTLWGTPFTLAVISAIGWAAMRLGEWLGLFD